ncbi:MAG: hypothetical protein IJT72_08515 [Lachnospiraceae bacterium]|nr:hypothetical protein [Lachnospiraceae bacterium]
MSEKIRESYFVFIRLTLLVVLSLYGIFNEAKATGVSLKILLVVSFYISLMSIKELTSGTKKKIIAFLGIILFFAVFYFGKESFYLLGIFSVYEILSLFPKLDYKWYFVPLLFSVFDLAAGNIIRPIVIFMMSILYIQHNFVITGYQKRLYEDIEAEHKLKKDMREQEYAAKEKMKRNMLLAENQILEEKTQISQTLHDKLGHNINGSVYQLEGVKVLMDKDPEKSKSMIQAVIDQLRTGMDEIRAILRKERPKKKELAMLQLYKLCEDCNAKGVEASVETEGDVEKIPENVWEVILDNAFEAVSNSMKYSKCKHIKMKLIVFNKMIRCNITDDGIGCKKIQDGMGISGMRQRIRQINGSLSFETEAGFSINMIIPVD